jgi:putative sigma-54 modulation protein
LDAHFRRHGVFILPRGELYCIVPELRCFGWDNTDWHKHFRVLRLAESLSGEHGTAKVCCARRGCGAGCYGQYHALSGTGARNSVNREFLGVVAKEFTVFVIYLKNLFSYCSSCIIVYMNIKITSKSFDITPAIEEYVFKRLSSLEKFLDKEKEILCEVEIGKTTTHHKSGDIFKAEINVNEPGSKQIYASAEAGDLYSAIDIVRDDAEREILSQKNKYKTLLRRGSAQIKNLIKRIDFRKGR